MLLSLIILVLVPYLYWVGMLSFEKKKKRCFTEFKREVSAVLIVYNEQEHIQRKITELLGQLRSLKNHTYELIIISDGSIDGTNQIIRENELHDCITVVYLNERKGKPHAINLAKRISKFENLVFSDSRQILGSNSLHLILFKLEKPEIGLVSAKLYQKCPSCVVRSVLNYSKHLQSISGNLVGAYGAFFAVRKSLVPEIPEHIILDDLYISLKAMDEGWKAVMVDAPIADIDFEYFYNKSRAVRLVGGLFHFSSIFYSKTENYKVKTLFNLFIAKYYRLTVLPLALVLCLGIDAKLLVVCFLLLFFKSTRHLMKTAFLVLFNWKKIGSSQSVLWTKFSS